MLNVLINQFVLVTKTSILVKVTIDKALGSLSGR